MQLFNIVHDGYWIEKIERSPHTRYKDRRVMSAVANWL